MLKGVTMILDFGFKNFFSFKEGFNVSFRLPSSCPESMSMGRSFSTIVGIKGANASGKTNIFRALNFLSRFCTNSFDNSPESGISVAPYYDSKKPCEFYVEFKLNDTEYRYELQANEINVVYEAIYVKKNRKTKVFERVKNEITFCTNEFLELKKIKLRSNASIISISHQYELKELNQLYKFFKLIQTNVNYGGIRESIIDTHTISKFLFDNDKVFEFVKKFIKECDVGVENIEITYHTKEGDSKEYFPIFLHKANKANHPVTIHTESSGTRALFKQLALYKIILDAGGLLALDEFDVYLHPHILPKLLNLFTNPDTNTKGAQVLFSTHQADVLDILGRHRTYLINKNDNESYGYRLDEVPGDILRNDRSISPAYNDGKIGGIPKL